MERGKDRGREGRIEGIREWGMDGWRERGNKGRKKEMRDG